MSAAPDEARRDLATALRNAIKLGGSLLATWAVALAVRFQLPRAVGPAHFGEFTFADSFSASLFIALGLGIDTYIQKEVSTRPKHASDFFGGVLFLRLVLSVVLLGVTAVTLTLTGRSGEILAAAMVFGLTQSLSSLSTSLSALLQAATTVGRLAVVNVVTKVLWGAGVLVALRLHPPLWVLVLPLLASELLKAILLASVVRRELPMRLQINVKATRIVLLASLPFFINTVAYTLGGKLDVTMLEFLAKQDEVGWYAAAGSLASLAMLLSPLVSWVLMPLLTRAKERSEEEFFATLRRATEAVLIGAIPAAMLLAVGADIWIHLAFGAAYGPAVTSLQVLAPSFVLTYAAVLLSTALLLFGRSWTVMLVSLGSLALQPALILLVVPFAAKRFGVGGAGIGSAAVFSFLELFSVVGFWWYLGRRAVDRRCLLAVGKSLAAFAVVAVVDRWLHALGFARLVIDAAIYALLVFASGAVRYEDVRNAVQLVVDRRRARS